MMTTSKGPWKSNFFVAGSFLLATLQLIEADTISVLNPSCIGVGEDIEIQFSKDNNGNVGDSWISIIRTGGSLANSENLPSGELWASLCGSQTCNPQTNPTSGTISFGGNLAWGSGDWPLQTGTYQAILTMGDDGEPWPALAVSELFEVGCNDGSSQEPDSGTPSMSVIDDARRDIENLIGSNSLLVGKFLRLVFHDCVGGCDGCVDMANPDNAGLVMPIEELQPIVDEYESLGLSRTDIWMLSGVVASEVADTKRGIGFPFQWVGRQTCEQIHGSDCGLDADGQAASCGRFNGPHRALCHGDTSGTATIRSFMQNEFGFDDQQITAIMGAHTVGAMHAVNLGFEGRRGWDLTNRVLDHGYFVELVDGGPNWRQVRRNNENLDGIPSRFQFEANVGGRQLTMLNSDIAMVRNLVEGQNLQSNGRVTCRFRGGSQCSSETPFMSSVRRYAASIDDFLSDYRDALDLMIDNGYVRDSSCASNEVCVLSRVS